MHHSNWCLDKNQTAMVSLLLFTEGVVYGVETPSSEKSFLSGNGVCYLLILLVTCVVIIVFSHFGIGTYAVSPGRTSRLKQVVRNTACDRTLRCDEFCFDDE